MACFSGASEFHFIAVTIPPGLSFWVISSGYDLFWIFQNSASPNGVTELPKTISVPPFSAKACNFRSCSSDTSDQPAERIATEYSSICSKKEEGDRAW